MGAVQSCVYTVGGGARKLRSQIENGDVKAVCVTLVEHPLLLSAPVFKGGSTIWHIAARYGQMLIVEAMMEHVREWQHSMRPALDPAAVINIQNAQKQTPLVLACCQGHAGTVELLLSMGANPFITDGVEGCTALHCAARYNHLDCARALLSSPAANAPPGGDGVKLVNFPSFGGATPIHYAANAGHVEMVRLLVQHGADITAEIKPGRFQWMVVQHGATPLHLAAEHGHLQVALVVLKHFLEQPPNSPILDPRNIRDRTGMRPHQVAFLNHHFRVALILRPGYPLSWLFDPAAGAKQVRLPTLQTIAAKALREHLCAEIDALDDAQSPDTAAAVAAATLPAEPLLRRHGSGTSTVSATSAAAAGASSRQPSGTAAASNPTGQAQTSAGLRGPGNSGSLRHSNAVHPLPPLPPVQVSQAPVPHRAHSSRVVPAFRPSHASPFNDGGASAGGSRNVSRSSSPNATAAAAEAQQQQGWVASTSSPGAAAPTPSAAPLQQQQQPVDDADDPCLTARNVDLWMEPTPRLIPSSSQSGPAVSAAAAVAAAAAAVRSRNGSMNSRAGGEVAGGAAAAAATPAAEDDDADMARSAAGSASGDVGWQRAGRAETAAGTSSSGQLARDSVAHVSGEHALKASSSCTSHHEEDDGVDLLAPEPSLPTMASDAADAAATARDPSPDAPPPAAGTGDAWGQRVSSGPAADVVAQMRAAAASPAFGDASEPCDVCFEEGTLVRLKPCHHQLCIGCARKLCKAITTQPQHCPFCRATLTGFKRAVSLRVNAAAAPAGASSLKRG